MPEDQGLEVERFTIRDEAQNRCEHPNGAYVRFEDYEKLKGELTARESLIAEVVGELERLAAESRREADNACLQITAFQASAREAAYDQAAALLTELQSKGGDACESTRTRGSGADRPHVAGAGLEDGSGLKDFNCERCGLSRIEHQREDGIGPRCFEGKPHLWPAASSTEAGREEAVCEHGVSFDCPRCREEVRELLAISEDPLQGLEEWLKERVDETWGRRERVRAMGGYPGVVVRHDAKRSAFHEVLAQIRKSKGAQS